MVHLLRVVSIILIITFLPVTTGQVLDEEGDILDSNLDDPSDALASSVRSRRIGLCRDGWRPGAIMDLHGQENPVCIKINLQPQTWSEAQATCRKDYGFLLKLDSPSTVNGVNLLPYLATEGIHRLWTGLHTYADHLVWDDLVPNLVKPHTLHNGTYISSRPWTWGNRRIPQSSKLCGQLNIKQNDKKRRRRKRAPDEDSPDGFFLPSLQDRLYQFRDSGSEKYLPTAEFQSMLSRTQFSDQLSEIPGIQSEHQIPGTGLSDTNLQSGGLHTELPTFESATKLEGDDKEMTNSDLLLNQNLMQDGFFATQPPMQQTELLDSVKDIAANLAKGTVPDLSSLMSVTDNAKEANNFNIESLKDRPIDTGALSTFERLQPDTIKGHIEKDVNLIDTLNQKDEGSSDKTILDSLKEILPKPPTLSTDDSSKNQTDDFSIFDAAIDTGTSVSTDDNNPPSFTNENDLKDALNENTGVTVDNMDQMKSLNIDDTDSTTVSILEPLITSSGIQTDDISGIKEIIDKDIEPVSDTGVLSDRAEVQSPFLDIPDGISKPSEDTNITPESGTDFLSNFGSIPDLSDLLNTETSESEIKKNIEEDQTDVTKVVKDETIIPKLDISESFPLDDKANTDEKTTLDILPDDVVNDATDSFETNIFEKDKPQEDSNVDSPIEINEDTDTSLFGDNKIDDIVENTIDTETDLNENETSSDTGIYDQLNDFIDSMDNDVLKTDIQTDSSDILSDIDTKSELPSSQSDILDDIESQKDKALSELDTSDSTIPDINDIDTGLIESIDDQISMDDILHDKTSHFGDMHETNADDRKDDNTHDSTLDETFEDNDHTAVTDFTDIVSDSIHDDFPSDNRNDVSENINDNVFSDDQLNNDFDDHNDINPFEDYTEVNKTTDDDAFDDTMVDHVDSDILDRQDDTISDLLEINEPSDLHNDNEPDLDHDNLDKPESEISGVIDDYMDSIDDATDDINNDLGSRNNDDDNLIDTDNVDGDEYDKVYDDTSSFDEDVTHVRERPDLAEDIEDENTKTLIVHPETSQDMELSTCGIRLPSVCFSYEVEVMTTASTCKPGWYGHVLLDSCYMILEGKASYDQARGMCKALGSRIAFGHSEFERKFILRAVEKAGGILSGERFWMEAASTTQGCQYFDGRGVAVAFSCDELLNTVCVKDAKSLSVYNADNTLYLSGAETNIQTMEAEYKLFSSRYTNDPLICELTSAASEFPVLWFKDGILLETKDKYVTPDISLHINQSLAEVYQTVTNRDINLAAMQGRYWCEVWDRKSLTRKTSRPYEVRFSDVISFHGSIQFWDFGHQDRILFNMMDEKFTSLENIELDLKSLFNDILMPLRVAFPDVVDIFTFVDRVRSTPSVMEFHTYLTLNRDYILDEESLVYSRVKAMLKSKLANSRYMASLPGRTPVSVFRTMSLQSTVACPEALQRTSVGAGGKTIPIKTFNFPQTRLGDFANSFDNCSSSNFYPAGTARCLGGFSTGAYWSDVIANDCIDEAFIDQFNEQIWGSSPFTDKLSEIAKTAVKPDNVDKIISQVAHITEVAAKLSPTDINKIADVLDHSTNVGKLSEKVGQNVLKTVDRLLASNEKEMHVANAETKAANRIIKSLERFAEQADLGKRNNVRMVSDNVVVELWDLKPNSGEVIGLAAKTSAQTMGKPFQDEIIATVFNKTQLADANVDAAIELPHEVFSQKEKGMSLGNRLTMMVFRKSKLFDAALTSDGKVLKATEKQLNNLNSYVISASIAGRKLTGLKDRVRTIFRPIKERDGTHKCVWWDFDMNNKRGGWSSSGCYYDGKINGRDICLCDHLTNFAVLLDFYGQSEPIPDHHELSLSIITVLGLALSILGLSLTIISYVFFRKLRKGRAQQTLFNLSLSLLFSMLVFLVGIKQTHSYVGCLVVAILLHYFILVSFMWMLMEAILQYLTFVKILGTYITRFTLKTVLPAWGLPLVPVIAVLSIDFHLYHGGPNYCWMDLPAFYFAFAIPITSIIVINIIIFFITIVSIFRRGKGLRSNQKKQKIAMTNLQAAITSFILLGLTWVFGYLAIADARLPFQYVFTILNSLQGFFIFILFVVRKKKARDQWYIICCKGGEKDRVSRSLSASNSIPSSYSNGSNRNSRNSRHERDRSDSTKTTQSTFSNSSGGFTNYGYEHGFDLPYNRNGKRFRKF